ncbi:MAG: CBS domain-containing protein [Gammaproteobacteria bacterium]|nr:CBS domain-containing protein [Gammaproteobacteria bacterium]
MFKTLLKPKIKSLRELRNAIEQIKLNKLIDPELIKMLGGVLDIANMQVRDVMIPRSQMISIKSNSSLEKILETVIKSGHSRFPVFSEDKDNVLGILLGKDLLPYTSQKQDFVLTDILRSAIEVPEAKKLNSMLKEFRAKHNHLAIVVNEYGNISGLITLEDVLEEIVGEIEDEFDINEEESIKKIGKNSFILGASLPIETFNAYFNTDFSDIQFDTIGGIIINKFGYIPKRGETITVGNLYFKITKSNKKQIELISIKQKEGKNHEH